MDIKICGHRRALKLLKETPNERYILMLSGPDNFFGVEGSEQIPEFAKECLQIAFHDIDFPRPGYQPPTKEDVEKAISWAKEKRHHGVKELIVACQLGISRSSAMAYIIKCSPNMIIVRHGADILQNPDICGIMLDWKYNAEETRTSFVDDWASDNSD
jgi:hypothetical protein